MTQFNPRSTRENGAGGDGGEKNREGKATRKWGLEQPCVYRWKELRSRRQTMMMVIRTYNEGVGGRLYLNRNP